MKSTNWTNWTTWKHHLPKLNQEESENLNRQIATSKCEAVIKKLPRNKVLDLVASQEIFTKHSNN